MVLNVLYLEKLNKKMQLEDIDTLSVRKLWNFSCLEINFVRYTVIMSIMRYFNWGSGSYLD